jgi:hypothetical protein
MKNRGDTKTTAITILAIVLLIVIVYAVKGNLANPSGATSAYDDGGSAIGEGFKINATRMWPSGAAPAGETPRYSLTAGDVTVQSADDPITIQQFQPKDIKPAIGTPVTPRTKVPYVFIVNSAPYTGYTWGSIYYSAGSNGQPGLIYTGNATAPYLAGDYVYFISVDRYYIDPERTPPLVLETTPRRMNISTHQVTTLDTMSDTPPWNSIGAADNDTYFYSRTDFGDRTSGTLKIYDNSVLVYNVDSGHMFADISENGRYMTWTEYGGAFPAGEDTIYRYNIQTSAKEAVYQAPDTIFHDVNDFLFWEPEYVHINKDGSKIAFTEVNYDQINGGNLDCVPHVLENGEDTILSQGSYRFSMGITIDGAWIFYPVATYGSTSNAIFSYMNGGVNEIAQWNASWIEPWLSAAGGTVVYKDNPTITDYLGSFHQQIADYSNPAKIHAFKGKKSNAL